MQHSFLGYVNIYGCWILNYAVQENTEVANRKFYTTHIFLSLSGVYTVPLPSATLSSVTDVLSHVKLMGKQWCFQSYLKASASWDAIL